MIETDKKYRGIVSVGLGGVKARLILLVSQKLSEQFYHEVRPRIETKETA